MHEASITQSIIDSVIDTLDSEGIDAPVREVRITTGVCQGLIPESMQMYYDMQTPGTRLDGSRLVIESQGMVARCDACDREHELDAPVMFCPDCGGAMELVKGDEILITSIEVDND